MLGVAGEQVEGRLFGTLELRLAQLLQNGTDIEGQHFGEVLDDLDLVAIVIDGRHDSAAAMPAVHLLAGNGPLLS